VFDRPSGACVAENYRASTGECKVCGKCADAKERQRQDWSAHKEERENIQNINESWCIIRR
jgi:ribosomal protein L37E